MLAAPNRKGKGDPGSHRIGGLESGAELGEILRSGNPQRDSRKTAKDRRQQEDRRRQHVARMEMHLSAIAQRFIIEIGEAADADEIEPCELRCVHRLERLASDIALGHAEEDAGPAHQEQGEQPQARHPERPVQPPLIAVDRQALRGQQHQPQGRGDAVRVELRRRSRKLRQIAGPECQRDQRKQDQHIPVPMTVRHRNSPLATPVGELSGASAQKKRAGVSAGPSRMGLCRD